MTGNIEQNEREEGSNRLVEQKQIAQQQRKIQRRRRQLELQRKRHKELWRRKSDEEKFKEER